MSAVPIESSRIQWLLALAAFCMLAQSTLLPLVSTAGALTPVHRHLTLSGVVPEHTHSFDDPDALDRSNSGCVVTPAASTEAGEAHNETLVCAPDDGTATPSVVGAVHPADAALPVALAGIESPTSPTSEDGWYSTVLGALTPPPRSNR